MARKADVRPLDTSEAADRRALSYATAKSIGEALAVEERADPH